MENTTRYQLFKEIRHRWGKVYNPNNSYSGDWHYTLWEGYIFTMDIVGDRWLVGFIPAWNQGPEKTFNLKVDAINYIDNSLHAIPLYEQLKEIELIYSPSESRSVSIKKMFDDVMLAIK